ncbi:MAG: hypothetical protein VX278_18960, partial [Myxococcota bacterium]|nr:hypothetical protein [Myxococcota bacterium]
SLTRHVEAYFDKKGEYQGSTGTQTIFHKHDDCQMLRLLCALLQTPRANQLFSIILGYNAMHSSISMEKSFLETFPIPKAIWDPAQQASPKQP